LPPSADQTNKMPVAGSRPETKSPNTGDPADKTAALPAQRAEGDDSSTEKLNTRDIQDENTDNGRRRRGGSGGLSAQDLLRREGRL
jgi:RND superfamily putative drug exporter